MDNGAEGGENVTSDMNSRFFRLCRVYYSSLKMWNIGEFPRSLFVGDRPQVKKQKQKFCRHLFAFSMKPAVMVKKCTKKHDAGEELLVC